MPQNLGANHPLQTPSTTTTLSSSAGPVNISFSFINDADVLVFLGGTLRTNGTGNDNYTINTAKTQVTFNNNVSGEVIITRKSDLLNKVRTFTAGSSVRAADLNTQFDQVMQLVQDNYELLRGIIQNDANDEITVGRTLLIKDDAVVTGSILDGAVTRPKIADDAVDGTKIADDAIDSEHYTDLSIDRVHLSNDIIDGSKLADDSVDSEHLVADSIDTEHYAPNSVDTAAIAANAVTVAEIEDAELKELATMSSGTASALADLTGTEVQILDDCLVTTDELNNSLDGCTATAAEINTLDGVNSTLTADELNILDGATVTATELNTLDGVNSTLTAADLNQLDSNTLVTSPTWTSDTQFPSANAIDARITARIDPIGGYEAIANEDSFPATAPPEGTIVSIANVGGMVVPAASGNPSVATTTDASRAGGSDTVTIQNIPATAAGQTLQDGLGMLVVATSTAHTYDFHRVVATDQDVIGLSRQMDDFAARYRVGSSVPTDGLCGLDGTGSGNRPCDGDMFFNTGTGKMLVYDGDSNTADTDEAVQDRWEEVQSIGNFKIIPATELADFASGSASVETITDAPTSAEQIILSINGVIQEPQAGSSAPTDGFALDGDIIRLSATPPASSEVWGVIIGSAVNIGTPSNNTVDTAQLVDDGVTNDKLESASGSEAVDTNVIRDDAVTAAKLADSTSTDADRAVTRNHIRNSAINADKLDTDAVTQTKIADEVIDEARLQVSNAPTNGQFLQCQSGDTGGLRWATVSQTTPTLQQVLDQGNQSTTDMSFINSGNATIEFDASTGLAVFNQNGNIDGDFRVESNNNENMLFVDAGNNRVGIGHNGPEGTLDVRGDIRARDTTNVQHTISPTGNTIFNERGLNLDFRIESDDNENMFFIDGSEDRVGIGTNTPEYTLDVTGTDAAALPAGTDAQRPGSLDANDEGLIRFNTTSGQFEYWANTDDTPQWRLIGDAPQRTISVEYLVIAGGGSGGAGFQGGCGGGGGAGGYRTNFGTGNISGRLSAVEAAMTVNTGSALSLTVGAGGTAMTGNTNSTDIPAGSDGNDSTFNTITSIGGGAGGRNDGGHGNDGGCGGGSGGRLASATNGDGTANQGFDGGDCTQDNDLAAGGGGGAGEAGSTGITSGSPNLAQGGDGIASSITGSSVTRGGGGGSAGSSSSCTLNSNQSGGLGGAGGGGGGAAANSANGTAGTANTGGGGGGNLRNCSSSNAGAGGSGVIILRTATGVTARFSAGVVVNGTTVSADNTAVAGTVVGGGSTDLVWTVTAAASDTVTFS